MKIITMKTIKNIIDEFIKLDCVAAITLGGSKSTNNDDKLSDYDIYIYYDLEPIDVMTRHNILAARCSYLELNNQYWETEDNGITIDGEYFDLLYRNINQIADDLKSVLIKGNARNGFTTAIVFNILNSHILYDKNHRYQSLKDKYSFPYPQKLKENIIRQNRNLLSGKIVSYDQQIAKAFKRNDQVNVINRVNEFLNSYFDIIFAYNEIYHPGEKRLIKYAKANAKRLPEDFEENITSLLDNLKQDKMLEIIKQIVINLDKLLNS